MIADINFAVRERSDLSVMQNPKDLMTEVTICAFWILKVVSALAPGPFGIFLSVNIEPRCTAFVVGFSGMIFVFISSLSVSSSIVVRIFDFPKFSTASCSIAYSIMASICFSASSMDVEKAWRSSTYMRTGMRSGRLSKTCVTRPVLVAFSFCMRGFT